MSKGLGIDENFAKFGVTPTINEDATQDIQAVDKIRWNILNEIGLDDLKLARGLLSDLERSSFNTQKLRADEEVANNDAEIGRATVEALKSLGDPLRAEFTEREAPTVPEELLDSVELLPDEMSTEETILDAKDFS